MLNLTNYYNYINKIIAERGQWSLQVKNSDRTCERHHIILKCKGGEPKYLNWRQHENVIWLYPAEHFEAHKILYLDNTDDLQIANSFVLMSNTKGISLTASDYELMKIAASKVFKKIRTGNKGPRLGMKTSEETKLKMSLAQKGPKSYTFGKKWINDGQVQKVVEKEKLDLYLSNGWVLGTLGLTIEQKQKDSEAIKNRIHIHNNLGQRKMIKQTELETWLNNGWLLGRGKLKRKETV